MDITQGFGTPIAGTATNNNAAAGYVGEYVTASLASGSAISLSTGVVANVVSISLTAGDWDISGVVSYHGSGTTNIADVKQGFNTVSATMGAAGTYSYDYISLVVSAADDGTYVTPTDRISLAAITTVYLVAMADFTVSTTTAYGTLRARRVR